MGGRYWPRVNKLTLAARRSRRVLMRSFSVSPRPNMRPDLVVAPREEAVFRRVRELV